MMRGTPIVGLALAATLLPGPAAAGQGDGEPARLAAIIRQAWEFELQEAPLFATRAGDHRFNDRLGRASIADQKRRLARRKEFLDRLAGLDRDALPRGDQMDYDILRRMLGDRVAEAEFEMYLIPITSREGFHISFPELPKRVPLETLRDYENYLARLQDFGPYADDHIELLRGGIAKGLVLPAVVLEGYRDSITAHIVDDAERSLLYAPFAVMGPRIGADDRARLADAGRAAVSSSVVPAYQRLLDFMQDEYLPACRGSIAAAALPRGREFYRHRVRRFTTLDLTPEAVHQTGLEEVQRIRAEMRAVIDKTGFEGDFAAFVEHLRHEPRFYAETSEQLIKETAYVLKKMDGQLPRLFRKLPSTPYGIREVPAYIAPKTTTAYYQQPAGDGSRAGFYYVNTYNLKARPLYGVEALSLHEAVPGHHLQIALQQELTGLHDFRRFIHITAFIEGWALYAERLGLEVGFYEDPYSDFGRLTYEMWRACRLVVDTGIHYFGWTRQQAIEYMSENTALSLHNIQAEVDRYISWPGQALAYKIGELKIRQLRDSAEQQLGQAFDIREFHDVVLGSGAVPLDVLAENVQRYVAEKSAGMR